MMAGRVCGAMAVVCAWTASALSAACAAQESAPPQGPLTALQARADMDILQQALTTLHPGLNRYLTPDETGAMFDALRVTYAQAGDMRARYLAISETLARIRCGHTYCNFLNQPDAIKAALFEGKDRVPFAFRFIGGRMIVTRDATAAESLPPGTEVRAINGVDTRDMVARLMLYVKADGGNDAKRMKDLEVAAHGNYEPFDIYHAAVYAPVPENYQLTVIAPGTSEPRQVQAAAMTRAERAEAIAKRYPEVKADAPWRFEVLDGGVGYLKLGTFVTRGLTVNWRDFLRESFGELKKQQSANLIIDIRGNEGGDDAIPAMLLRYVLSAPVMMGAQRELLRYDVVSELLAPHLSTWDESFKDRRKSVVEVERGWYTWKTAKPGPVEYRPGSDAFEGMIFLLVDAANSSATFRLAQVMSADPRTTLVGQTTGGNLRGTNGSQMFFLRLPNSKIEIDIPLVGVFPESEQPDAGLEPDVVVTPTMDGIINGVDEELQAALALIGQ